MSRKLVFAIAALCFAAAEPAWAADAVNPSADFKAFRDYLHQPIPESAVE